MEYLLSLRQRMNHAKELLTNPELTSFFFVTLPEALPIAVIRRFIQWFHEFGIPVGGVIVNMCIDRAAIGEKAPEFVLNRLQMQDQYLEEIRRTFPDVRAIVPLFETEVCGVSMLERTAEHLFGAAGGGPA